MRSKSANKADEALIKDLFSPMREMFELGKQDLTAATALADQGLDGVRSKIRRLGMEDIVRGIHWLDEAVRTEKPLAPFLGSMKSSSPWFVKMVSRTYGMMILGVLTERKIELEGIEEKRIM